MGVDCDDEVLLYSLSFVNVVVSCRCAIVRLGFRVVVEFCKLWWACLVRAGFTLLALGGAFFHDVRAGAQTWS